MRKLILSVTTLLLRGMATEATNWELNVGNPAPKLVVRQFFKGDSVKSPEKGKTCVLVHGAPGEKWRNPNQTLRGSRLSFPDGDSLRRLLARLLGLRNRANVPHQSVARILG
jgi:hypothetical protein